MNNKKAASGQKGSRLAIKIIITMSIICQIAWGKKGRCRLALQSRCGDKIGNVYVKHGKTLNILQLLC